MRSQETIRVAQEIKNEIDTAIEKEKMCNEAIDLIEDKILDLEISLEEIEDEIEDADEDEDMSYEYEERKNIRKALKSARAELKSRQNQLIIAQYELNVATRRSENFLEQLNEFSSAASENIASVSNMVGEYSEIGVLAGNEWKRKLDNYSSAAGVLGAALNVSSDTASGSGASSHSGGHSARFSSTSGFSSGAHSGGSTGSGAPQGKLGSSQQSASSAGGSHSGGAIGGGVPQEKRGSSQQPALSAGGSHSGGAAGGGAPQGKLGSSQQSALSAGGSHSGGAAGGGAPQGKLGSSQQPASSTGGSHSGGAAGGGAPQGKLGSSQQSASSTGGSHSGGAAGGGAPQGKLGSTQQSALLTGGSHSGGAIGGGAPQGKLGSSQQPALLTCGSRSGSAVQVHGNLTSRQSTAMPLHSSRNIGEKDNKKSFVEKVYRTLVKHNALQTALLATETVESVFGAIDKAMDIKDIDFNSVLNSPKNTSVEQAADRISESSLQDILSLMNYTVGEKDDRTKPTADLTFFAKCLYSFGTDSEVLLKSSDELRELSEEEVKISGALNAPNTPNTPNTSGKDPDDHIKTSIDSKVKAAERCVLPKGIAETFIGGKYKTVEATEDMTLYRVFGGKSKKQGSYLTTQKPSDRLYSKVGTALTPNWKNTRQYYCEVFIPKGTIMNIGLVEKQVTQGGDTLTGGLEQIVVSKEFANNPDNYGETRELGFGSGFLDFSKAADKIEEDEE